SPVRQALGRGRAPVKAGRDRRARRYRRGRDKSGTWSFRIWHLMHVVFRESRGLEETATPRDIGQDPADLVVLSYSDSDLAAFAAGWRRRRAQLPAAARAR